MNKNQISNLNQRITIVIMFIFSVLNPMIADNFNKYVGQSFILPIPKSPVSSGFVNSWSYSCSSTNISIINRGSSNPSEAVITNYFDGTLYIECFFQYIYYVNNVPRTGTRTETHRVTCISNNISISAPRNTLSVNETMQMSYRFSTSTFDATPQITWQSSSSAIVINNNGYVVAKSSGTAIITARSNLGNNVAECSVTVQRPVPISVSITTTQSELYCEEGLQLRATVSPSEAPQSITWSMETGNSSIATVSSSGYLRGVSKGRVTVKATAENGVSDSKSFTIVEPTFSYSSSSPSNNSTGISVFVKPSATFSHDLYEGSNYASISLKDADKGSIIAGTASRSGKTVTFTPASALQPQTNYTLTIPANAIKNKWGTHYSSAISVNFKTGNLEKLSLTSSRSDKFLSAGDRIFLTASKSATRIYYTLDGSAPTIRSTLYTGEIVFEKDIKLRAIAMGDGYESSDVLAMDYYLSNVGVSRCFPDSDTKLYIYKDVIPSLTFGNRIEPSDNINNVELTKNGEIVEVEAIVTEKTLFIIPKKTLELGCKYSVIVPANAVKTWQGESCKDVSWSFTTGYYATDVSIGNELAGAVMTDGSLLTWGQRLKNANTVDGSYEYTSQNVPTSFVTSDVVAVSSGYMHHALIKRDGSLWMWGRQYCGEFGNGSTTASAQPIKIMDGIKSVSCGLQTTAIVKQDGTLWMCGRNDLGQIDESYMVRQQYVMVDEGVEEATLSWGAIKVVKNDGTTETRVWDTEIDSQRQPSMPTNFGVDFEEVEFGWKNAVVLGKDGSVWAWQDSTQGEDSDITPTMIIEGRKSSELEGLDIVNPVIFLNEGGRSVITALPKPLTADYTALSWTSSDDNVAVVSQKGIVTAVALGKAILTVTITGTTGETYKEECKVIVSDALLLKAKSYAREYGEENPVFEYTVEGGGLEGEPEIVCEAEVTSPVGDYPIIIRKGNVQNHNDNYEDGVLTITKASLTVDVGTYTKRQFEPMPQFSPVFIGFKNDETEDVLTKPVLLSCDADEDSAPGEYAIVASGADADNYEIQYVVGTLIVTEAATYSLVYLVDGEEHLRLPIKHRDVIIPLSEPTKEGYTFGGWSEIPTTMPAHDVEVMGTFYLYGDVNTDTKVNVVDVVDIARFVVDTPSENFRDKLADLNRDLTVNIADAVVLVNHIAGDQNLVKAEVPIGKPHDYKACGLELQAREMNELSLCLTGDADFTAFQLEIDVPDGMEISDMRINGQRKDGHQLLYNKVSDNCYRVAALSLSNAVFKDKDGELLNISFEGAGLDAICINDIHFVTTNGTDISFEALHVNANATSVPSVDKAKKGMDNVFDLSGRKLPRPQKGVNIVGGKKVFVR